MDDDGKCCCSPNIRTSSPSSTKSAITSAVPSTSPSRTSAASSAPVASGLRHTASRLVSNTIGRLSSLLGKSATVTSSTNINSNNSTNSNTTCSINNNNNNNDNHNSNVYHLFAYPAESNFTGRRYPHAWVTDAHNGHFGHNDHKGTWRVLLDTAKYCSTAPLDLSVVHADFVVMSFYKLFGINQ